MRRGRRASSRCRRMLKRSCRMEHGSDHAGRSGIPGRVGAHDRGRPDGQGAAGRAAIRLMTNLQIYWDQVLDGSERACGGTDDRGARSARRRCTSADIRNRLICASPGDLDYDYDRVSLTGPFQHQRGNYTRFGNVTPLVQGNDNRFVIFGAARRSPRSSMREAARAARRTGSAITSSMRMDM